MDRTEKERRNEIKRFVKSREKEVILSSCPIPIEKLSELFDFLDGRLPDSVCDSHFTITFEYLEMNGLAKQPFVDWLVENGGGCDCEILFNVEGVIND